MSRYTFGCNDGCTLTLGMCEGCGQELQCDRTYVIECDGINGSCPPEYVCELCAESHDSSCEECSDECWNNSPTCTPEDPCVMCYDAEAVE